MCSWSIACRRCRGLTVLHPDTCCSHVSLVETSECQVAYKLHLECLLWWRSSLTHWRRKSKVVILQMVWWNIFALKKKHIIYRLNFQWGLCLRVELTINQHLLKQCHGTDNLTLSLIFFMMTSLYGNFFRVSGYLCGEFTSNLWIPRTKPVTHSFDAFFDLRLNKRLSKESWG